VSPGDWTGDAGEPIRFLGEPFTFAASAAPALSRDELKALIKEAVREVLDEERASLIVRPSALTVLGGRT
jgi:hypothetical protein